MPLFQGIKVKMTTAIVASVLGTAVALSVITSFLINYTFHASLKARAQENAKILSEALSGRQRQLAIRAEVAAGDNDFQTAYAFRDDELPRLNKELLDRVEKTGASLGFVADLNGHQASAGAAKSANVGGEALAGSVALKHAIETSATATTIESFGDRAYVVAATPIKRYETQTLGYLVFAAAFDDSLLKHLKEASGADVLLEQSGLVRLGTCALDAGGGDLAKLDQRLSEEVVPVDGLSAGGNPLLASAMPLRAGGKLQAALLFALSAKEANALQRSVLRASVGLAIITTILSGLIGLLVARRISNPIVAIEHSFRDIAASGDLSRRITEHYADEVGNMADSFNQMQDQIEKLHARVVTAEARMRDELKMASVVQEMLFPATTFDGPRCQIASSSQTSTETGGDWFTVIDAPDQMATTVVIADVTGHGAPAALVTAILHGFFKATRSIIAAMPTERWRPTMESVLRSLNMTVIESTKRSLTSSLALLTFDHRTLKAHWVNAGHLAPVLVRRDAGKVAVSTLTSAPSSMIGDIEEPNLAWCELQLAPGQTFLLYTDGLVECTNAANEMYSYKRLRRLLASLPANDARSVRDLVLADALAFYGDMPRADDITVIVGNVR